MTTEQAAVDRLRAELAGVRERLQIASRETRGYLQDEVKRIETQLVKWEGRLTKATK